MRHLRLATDRLRGSQRLEPRLVLAAPPVAVADSYVVDADSLTIAASGVLANDFDTDADPLTALLEQAPAHGMLTLNPDGSFQYTPTPGFSGLDTFRYQAVTLHPTQVFEVDRAQSSLRVDATLNTTLGTRMSSDTSSLVGTLSTRVSPANSPFGEIHLNDLDLTLTDGLTLNFDYGFFGGITATAPSDPSSDPNLKPLQLGMVTPGGPATVTNSAFTQTGNDLMLSGIADVQASGLLAAGVPSGPTELNLDSVILDLPGTLVQAGATVTVTLPIAFTGTFEFDGGTIDVELSGNVVARGPVATAEASSAVVVTLDVQPPAPAEIGRHLFYADSAFDSAGAAAAIATSVEALLPGETSSGVNMSSYVQGLNGLVVDLPAGGMPAQLSAADFTFRVGKTNDTTNWLEADEPASFRVESSADGGQRVIMAWPGGTIADTWLEVTVLANARTGLAVADTFYFGNLRGDANTDGQVNASDFAEVRSRPATFLEPAAVDDAHDTNHDARVNATDLLLVRQHTTPLNGGLPMITPHGGAALQQRVNLADNVVSRPSVPLSGKEEPLLVRFPLDQAIELAADARQRELLTAMLPPAGETPSPVAENVDRHESAALDVLFATSLTSFLRSARSV